jgi:hypothetical protein
MKKYLFYLTAFYILLVACQNKKNENTNTGIIEETDFNKFIFKFSSDSLYQIEHTKFPFKITWEQEISDLDSIFYTQKTDYRVFDFRRKKSTGTLDQWEQKIEVDKSGNKAIIQVLGIDNGIHIQYNFQKLDNRWTFLEMIDSST